MGFSGFEHTRFLVLFLILSLGTFAAAQTKPPGDQEPLSPQEQTPDESKFNFNIYLENDTKRLGGAGADSGYTNGIKLSFLYSENHQPNWVRPLPIFDKFVGKRPYNFGMGIGQQLYTPEELTRTDLVKDDRPYAGWLYVSPVLNVKNPNNVETFEINLGIVGPSAQGETTQRHFHKFIHVTEPEGWRHQLRDEFGFAISYQRKYQVLSFRYKNEWKFFDLIGYYGGSAGNILTAANAGVIPRLGYNLPSDFGPTRPSGGDGESFVRTTDPTPSKETQNWSIYIFGGLKATGVLHNLFLDGNTFGDSHRVTRVPLQGDYEGGFFVQFKNFGVTWRQVTRTPEFYERFKPHSFGSMTLTYGQRF